VLVTLLVLVSVVGAPGCRRTPQPPAFEGEPFLLVWAGDADRQAQDFLAVIDADPTSTSYGAVVHTVPVGSRGNEPYAMEARQGADGLVFAGGLLTGRTFVFDVHDPRTAQLLRVDTPTGPRRLTAPRGYVRLANGHRIGAFGDRRGYRGGAVEMLHSAGGLVEFDPQGRFVRELDGSDRSAAGMLISPHGIAVSTDTDRLITTDAGHGYTAEAIEWAAGVSVQMRKASTTELFQTIPLGVGERGDENLEPHTVHLLKAGSLALVNTGEGSALYASWTIATTTPTFTLVYDFGEGALAGASAVTPNGRFYLQALTGANTLEVLDVREPKSPRPVRSLRFDRDPERPAEKREGGPSRLAIGADGRRVAVANYMVDVPARYRDGDRRVYVIRVNPDSGAVGFDPAFRDEFSGAVGVEFNRTRWPHGDTGPARPGGVLFVSPVARAEKSGRSR
jgi:hypothetical protein